MGKPSKSKQKKKRKRNAVKKRRQHTHPDIHRAATAAVPAEPVTLSVSEDAFINFAHWLLGHHSGKPLDEWKAALLREHPTFISREIEWWIGAGLTVREYHEKNPGADVFICYLTALAASMGVTEKIDPRLTPELRNALLEEHNRIQATDASAKDMLSKWWKVWKTNERAE